MTTTITATPQPTATPPRVRLDITTDQPSLTVYRVAQDGTKTPVRTNDGGPLQVTAGSAFLYDPEVPQGLPVTFTSDDAATTGSATVAVDSGKAWLIHPAVPARSVVIDVVSVSDRQSPASQAVRYPLGRRFPIVANDGVRKAGTFTLVLATEDSAALAALDQILADLSTLLLNVPPSLGWIDPSTEYVAVGDLTRSNPAGKGYVTDREWSLPCSVTDRPAGGSQAFNTYGYSKSLYATYADRKAAHATYGEAFDIE